MLVESLSLGEYFELYIFTYGNLSVIINQLVVMRSRSDNEQGSGVDIYSSDKFI